ETLLNPDSSAEEKTYTLRGDEEESNVTPVPARIREIITRNLADTPTGESSEVEENRLPKDLPSQMCTDRDQLLSRQAVLTSR
ncbi:hypothetical protein M9458_013730, partial [Cirrhinus mrigala]